MPVERGRRRRPSRPRPRLVGSVLTAGLLLTPTAAAAADPEPASPIAPRTIVPGRVLELRDQAGGAGAADPATGGRGGGSAAAEALARQVEGLLSEQATPDTVSPGATFTVSSFNVLGDGHSRKRGVAGGPVRARWAAQLLRRHDVEVAGLQEFQLPQVRAFARAAPEYAAFPGASLGAALSHNSIVWDTRSWRLVRAETTRIPYFRGNRLRMPHVLLEHRESGERVWFMNYHNPADAHGPAQRWRDLATRIEARLANRLIATGEPVVMTGDFNDRADFVCPVTRLARLHSADGARTENGRCVTPGRMNVDWILGSPDVGFSGFTTDRSALVARTSDHPMIRATVTVGGL